MAANKVNSQTSWWLSLGEKYARQHVRTARQMPNILREAWRYVHAHRRYASAAAEAGINITLVPFPQLMDRSRTTPFDPHYVHQGPWTLRHLTATKPKLHVDIASYVGYLGFFATVAPTEFVDIRPVKLGMPGVTEHEGSVLKLPYDDQSLASVSCLHVVEHIGLGRYGDPLDPLGTAHACAELARVLAPGGILYLSAPIGRPRVCFNAHRVHSMEQLRQYTAPLRLLSFDAVLDNGSYVEDCDSEIITTQEYACGLFRFTR